MTTVAFRDGVMACDTRMTGGFISVCKDKIVSGREAIVGFCGDPIAAYCGAQYLAGELQDRPIINSKDDVLFLMYREGSLYMVDGDLRELPLDGNKYFAIGSGEQAAMVAMHMGATARDAVAMAIKVDENSGGRIKVFTI